MSLYRLYLDESGDHTFSSEDDVGKRYLGLVGCCFRAEDYVEFHDRLEALKRIHFPHHPDDPPILHRKDIIHGVGPFSVLRDPTRRMAFDEDLLSLIRDTRYRLFVIVIDKVSHGEKLYRYQRHPYHYCLHALLERYCGWLRFSDNRGDVMVESRGGEEDRRLKAAYKAFYNDGTHYFPYEAARRVLTSHELKLKPKAANISGLQLADVLANPLTREVLVQNGVVPELGSEFAEAVQERVRGKYNRQVYTGQVRGYGHAFLT